MNIKRAEQFIITDSKGTQYYGGDQGWFSSNTRYYGGCGPVSAVNSLRALVLKDSALRRVVAGSAKIPRPVKNVLCKQHPNKEDYALLMNGMYSTMGTFEIFPLNLIYNRKKRDNKFFKYIKPNNGQVSIGYIIGIIRFARKFGIDICVEALPTAFCDITRATAFIESGLEESGAVVLMTSLNKHSLTLFPGSSDFHCTLSGGYESTMKSHFVTISDIDRDSNRLLISTWGRPATIDFNELVKSWHSIRAFTSTLFYIRLSSRQESQKCMRNSWKIYVKGILQALIRRYFP